MRWKKCRRNARIQSLEKVEIVGKKSLTWKSLCVIGFGSSSLRLVSAEKRLSRKETNLSFTILKSCSNKWRQFLTLVANLVAYFW